MTTAREAVEQAGFMESVFAASLSDRIAADLEVERGRWVWDPQVDGVVGFQVRSPLGWEFVVIVYLAEEDFEGNALYCDGEWRYS